MVSCGPDTQSYLYTHMWSFVDRRKGPEAKKMCVDDKSIFGFIYNNPMFSKFRLIIERAEMEGQLNSSQANCTIFVPPDANLKHIHESFFQKIDSGTAKQILNASTLNRKIDKSLITSSPVAYYTTKDPKFKMYVTNISGKTRINNCATVIGYNGDFSNGMIHLVDNIIMPTEDKFMS